MLSQLSYSPTAGEATGGPRGCQSRAGARLGSDPTSDPTCEIEAIPETTEAPQVIATLPKSVVELRGIEPLTLRLPA